MRVIAGKYRGTKLNPPADDKIRPTTDRVKETMFGVIQFDIAGAYVLDLFAGSGALGIEAASRGAAGVVMADGSPEAIELIKSNLKRIKEPAEIILEKNDYVAEIKLFKNSKKFDIVFIDPPYSAGVYENAVSLLVEQNALKPGAILVLESEGGVQLGVERVELWKSKKAGITHLDYYRYREETNE